jgi:hypothetical protein
MSERCTVVIGAPEFLEALRARAVTEGEILSFGDKEPLKALEAITMRSPRVVTLERLFAATSRGAALINRIKSDPALASTEIRVESHDGSYSRVSPRRAPAPPPAAQLETKTTAPTGTIASPDASREPTTVPLTAAIDFRGTRRAPRFKMAEGTELQVDGALAKIVDLSTMGAQILSQAPLRPQQRVRITLADDLGLVKFHASVAWASFEIPKGVSRYRAGLEFKDAETGAVDAFCRRHQTA